MQNLGIEELEAINGGTKWGEIFVGAAGVAGAVAGLVAAPEVTIPVVISYYSALASAGYTMYDGTAN